LHKDDFAVSMGLVLEEKLEAVRVHVLFEVGLSE
jgi:hypothetical protein